MKIGVDCDGVLTDMSAYIQDCGEKFFKRKPTNYAGYSVKDVFECSEKENILFGLRYFSIYCKKWPPRAGAVETLNRLCGEGHKLYEITARMFITQRNPLGWYSRHMFQNWVKEYGFQFEDIYFCAEERAPEDKLSGCRKYDVDLMIDDKPEVALHLANHGIKVLLFDTLYNQNIEHENMIRVRSWEDIEKVVRGEEASSVCVKDI